jgi:hypothetical protein
VGDPLGPGRFVLFIAGLVTVGAAVSMRLRTAGQAFDERVNTAALLAVAGFAALVAYLGTDPAWDSFQMLLVALIAVSLLGVVLVLLPTPARMLVVSVLIVVHFGGMITAATSVDPPNGAAPWVARVLHQWFYRPYLEFMYLNNAYHFYSPDPGPPSLVWFHIKYEDGKVQWIKIPHRDDDPVPVHHVRLLSITESTSVLWPQSPWPVPVENEIKSNRLTWGREFSIPMAPDWIMASAMQQQEAQPYSQKMLESYVRHIADVYPWLGKPSNGVKSIKVYRFRPNIINTEAMADRREPEDRTLFIGFYQGEYDKEGKLLYPDVVDKDGKLDRKDALRFWYMPIYYRPKDRSKYTITPEMRYPDDLELVDCLTQHARLDLSKEHPEVTDDPTDSPWGAREVLRISSDGYPVVASEQPGSPQDDGAEKGKP